MLVHMENIGLGSSDLKFIEVETGFTFYEELDREVQKKKSKYLLLFWQLSLFLLAKQMCRDLNSSISFLKAPPIFRSCSFGGFRCLEG